MKTYTITELVQMFDKISAMAIPIMVCRCLLNKTKQQIESLIPDKSIRERANQILSMYSSISKKDYSGCISFNGVDIGPYNKRVDYINIMLCSSQS